MRLKRLNFSNSSSTYKVEQEKAMTEMSDNINSIGDTFDKFCELENFILDRINTKLTELNLIRDTRVKIEESSGTQDYLKKFKLASDKLNNRLLEAINEWNELSGTSMDDIIKHIEDYKELVKMLDEIQKLNKNFETLDNLKNLINEFGRFKLIKIVMTKDISEKINLFIKYKNDLVLENNLEEKTKKRVLSIDDL